MNTRVRRPKCRITVRITGDKVRLAVEERTADGKFVPMERPRGAADLARFKKAAKAVTLLAQGVADVDEICRTANTARGPRRQKASPRKDAQDGKGQPPSS
jgi:hypothetical protein